MAEIKQPRISTQQKSEGMKRLIQKHRDAQIGKDMKSGNFNQDSNEGLIRCILTWFQLHGIWAVEPKPSFTPSVISADVHAIVNGRHVWIDIKTFNGKTDAMAKRTGAVYLSVKSFDEFIIWFEKTVN